MSFRTAGPIRLRVLAVLIAALFAVGCASESDDIRSDSGPQTTDGEGKTTELPDEEPADETTTTTDPPAAPSHSSMMQVVGNVVVPEGEPGKLSVVLVGAPAEPGATIPVAVRNRTKDTLYEVEASGTARDGAGALVGSGSSQGFWPNAVHPGEWAFGYLYFSAELPADVAFDVTATAEDDAGFLSTVDVRPVETNLAPSQYSGMSIVGIVANETAKEVGGPVSVAVACFDETGAALLGVQTGYTDGDTIVANGTASFSVDLFDRSCPAYVVASSGYDF